MRSTSTRLATTTSLWASVQDLTFLATTISRLVGAAVVVSPVPLASVQAEVRSASLSLAFSGAPVTGTAVVVDGSGQLGVAPSSARFKEAIKSMDNASEALFSLKPVTFRYKKEIDPQGISQLGLMAEEVEKVNRDLVVRDKDGKPFTVRYYQVNARLLT